MIQNISHMTFIVQNLDKATQFFTEIFDAKIVYNSQDKTFSLSKERFFLIWELRIAIMEGDPLPSQTYNHIAFKKARPRVAWEWASIYFYDYDNHLFELHTGTLEERLETYS